MKWVRDNTGRFIRRPHYDPSEIDFECEQVIETFLRKRYGKVEYPISTSDLTVLIESWVEDLDMGRISQAKKEKLKGSRSLRGVSSQR